MLTASMDAGERWFDGHVASKRIRRILEFSPTEPMLLVAACQDARAGKHRTKGAVNIASPKSVQLFRSCLSYSMAEPLDPQTHGQVTFRSEAGDPINRSVSATRPGRLHPPTVDRRQ